MPEGNRRLPAQPESERTGKPGSFLHSRYNPQAEAARYIDSLQLKDTTECFILIEPGLGYIIPVLREKFEKCKIIALHLENFPRKHDCPAVCGTERSEVKKFLDRETDNIIVDRIRIIEWRPSLNHYREKYVNLLSQVVEFLKQSDAERRTTAAFGRRWFKNFFRNLEIMKNVVLYRQTRLPVIVTGSGPSLEQALPLISAMQKNCVIIAASSSQMALSYYGITADIVTATDGGNWALKHMTASRQPCPILAANLCAALPSQSEDTPFLVINDGSFWQNIILQDLVVPSIIIGQRGTVTATAVELAMFLSSGNIYLAGMDFSNNDMRTHVKPYAFDGFFFTKANRILPVYSTIFTRSGLLQKGGSMSIYAAWFKDQLPSWHKNGERIFSLTENKIFKHAKPEALSIVKNTDKIFNIANIKKDNALLRKRGADILFSALNNPAYAAKIKEELTSLLFSSGGSNVTKEELERAIAVELEAVRN